MYVLTLQLPTQTLTAKYYTLDKRKDRKDLARYMAVIAIAHAKFCTMRYNRKIKIKKRKKIEAKVLSNPTK